MSQIATLAASKAIRKQLGGDDQRRLVDDALAELRETVANTRGEVWGTKA
jgi:hypothetical protein